LSAIPRVELGRRLRREFERFQFEVRTQAVWESGTTWGRVTDVSRNGLFIELAEPPGFGAHFTANLALNVPLQLHCVVRRVVPGRGIGVSLAVPAESKKRFEALLTALSLGADPAATAAKAQRSGSPRPTAKLTAVAVAAGAGATRHKN
jgi:PilZ domain-containing protein